MESFGTCDTHENCDKLDEECEYCNVRFDCTTQWRQHECYGTCGEAHEARRREADHE